MLQKFIALILAILFVALFSFPSFSTQQILWGIVAMILVTAVANFWFYRQLFRLWPDFTVLLLPTLWIVASSIAVMLQPSTSWQFLVAFCCAVLLVKLELNLQPKAITPLIDGLIFLSAAGIFLGIWAAAYYYTPAWWTIMVLMFVACLILFWTGFFPAAAKNVEKFLYAIFLAFLFTQFSWAFLFWSPHFITVTVAFLGLFYLAWILTRFYLSGLLDRKKVFFHLVFVGAVEFIVMATALWLPKS